ncbi:MAG: Ubiquitin C-terminal hydrolase 22 [Geoglossum simile]|nr:MAG: Ubiquitin C-terminal hydrolase 22 [Geoglossum simile]
MAKRLSSQLDDVEVAPVAKRTCPKKAKERRSVARVKPAQIATETKSGLTTASHAAKAVENLSPTAPAVRAVGDDKSRKRRGDDLEKPGPAKEARRPRKLRGSKKRRQNVISCHLPSPTPSSSSPSGKSVSSETTGDAAGTATPPSSPPVIGLYSPTASIEALKHNGEPLAPPLLPTTRPLSPSTSPAPAPNPPSSSRAAPKARRKVLGLRNHSNMCFHNSIIQCLANTRPIVDRYVVMESKQDKRARVKAEESLATRGMTRAVRSFMQGVSDKKNVNVSKALGEVLGQLKAGDPEQTHVSSVKYCQTFADAFGSEYSGMKSQDANDVFMKLAERLHEEDCGGTAASLFETVETTGAICHKCGEPGDPVSGTGNGIWVNFPESRPGKQAFTLNECLRATYEAEEVDQRCSRCGGERFTRTTTISNEPPYLVVNVRRWKTGINQRGDWDSWKDNTKVDFPVGQDLDLSPWASDPATRANHAYECYAVIEHDGQDGPGHYVAYVNRDDGWWYISDEKAQAASLDEVRAANPYLIFYRKKE